MKSEYYFNDLLERENIKIYAMPSLFTRSLVLATRNEMPITVADLLDRIGNVPPTPFDRHIERVV